MKGARALASGMLVLAAACAVPAISAAQDAGTTTDATTTTTTTPATPPAPVTTTPETPPASAGARSPNDRPAADRPSGGSPAVPAATPADVASGSSTPKAKKSSSGSVTMINFAFSPASVTVNVGDTVTWTNHDSAPHNATADDGSFSTPNINNGQSASHRFTQPGTFSYICTIHPNMHGTIRVVSSSSGGGGNSGASGTNARSGSSGSSQSEASAAASPNAAGNGNTLPMTGMAAGALALVGLALLNSGLIVRAWNNRRAARERQQTPL